MNRRRPGYVIIEMLLVMTALVIMFGLCIVLIHSLLRLDRAGRDHLAEATTRDRLGRQFRRDVHAASQSSLARGEAPAADRLELKGAGGHVVAYAAGDGRIVRTERDGDRQTRREEYRFESRAVPRFQSREENGALFVVLSLRRKPAVTPAAPQRDAAYEALLGRDARLASRQGGGS